MPPRFPPSVYLHQLHTVAVAVAAAGDYLLARDQCVARYLEGKIKCARLLTRLSFLFPPATHPPHSRAFDPVAQMAG
jgi:hypothetical protein